MPVLLGRDKDFLWEMSVCILPPRESAFECNRRGQKQNRDTQRHCLCIPEMLDQVDPEGGTMLGLSNQESRCAPLLCKPRWPTTLSIPLPKFMQRNVTMAIKLKIWLNRSWQVTRVPGWNAGIPILQAKKCLSYLW